MGETVERLASGLTTIDYRFNSLEESLQSKIDEKLTEFSTEFLSKVPQGSAPGVLTLHPVRPPPSPPRPFERNESLDSVLEHSAMLEDSGRSPGQASTPTSSVRGSQRRRSSCLASALTSARSSVTEPAARYSANL